MSEGKVYCTCCNSEKPEELFEGNEKSQLGKFKTCEPCRNKWRIWKAESRKKKPEKRGQTYEVTEKVCRGCNHGRGPAQPATNFGTNRRNPDGLADRCFKCQHRQNELRRKEYKAEYRDNASRYGALTPVQVAELIRTGKVKDQTPGYWMKVESNKKPCWKELRDYNRAWANITAPPKTVDEPSPSGGIVGTTLFEPPDLDPCIASTNRASTLRQLEFWASLAG